MIIIETSKLLGIKKDFFRNGLNGNSSFGAINYPIYEARRTINTVEISVLNHIVCYLILRIHVEFYVACSTFGFHSASHVAKIEPLVNLQLSSVRKVYRSAMSTFYDFICTDNVKYCIFTLE